MMDHLTMRQRALVVVLGLGALLGLGSALRGHARGDRCPFGRARVAAPAAHYPPPAAHYPPPPAHYSAPYASPYPYPPPPPPGYSPWGYGWHDHAR